MPFPPRRVSFADYIFIVDEKVYEPAEDTFLIAQNLTVSEGDYVLDMGTGCGILGIIAAERGCRVIAVDLNPFAIRCAKNNARVNHLSKKMDFMQSNLFATLRTEERFDLILFNPPYLPVEQPEDDTWLERSWAGGVDGRRIIDFFISESPMHLHRTGRILLLQSTLSDLDKTIELFEKQDLRTRIVAKKSLPFFESLVLVEALFERTQQRREDALRNINS